MDALASLLRKRLVAADDVRAVFSEIEPPFEGYRRTLEVLRSYIKAELLADWVVLHACGTAQLCLSPKRRAKRTSIRVQLAGVCRVRAAHRRPQELRQPECLGQSRPNSR